MSQKQELVGLPTGRRGKDQTRFLKSVLGLYGGGGGGDVTIFHVCAVSWGCSRPSFGWGVAKEAMRAQE